MSGQKLQQWRQYLQWSHTTSLPHQHYLKLCRLHLLLLHMMCLRPPRWTALWESTHAPASSSRDCLLSGLLPPPAFSSSLCMSCLPLMEFLLSVSSLFSHHIFVLLSLRVIFPVYLSSSFPAPFSFFYDLFSLTLLTHSLTFYVSYIKFYSYMHVIKLWQIGKAIHSRERTVQWYGRDEIGRGINWYALWVNLLSHTKYVVILICFVL